MKTAYKRIATIVLLNLAALTRAQTPTLDYPVLTYGQDAEFTEMNHYDSDGTYYPFLDSWAEENTALGPFAAALRAYSDQMRVGWFMVRNLSQNQAEFFHLNPVPRHPENDLCNLLWPSGGGDKYDCEGAIVICADVSYTTGATCKIDGSASCSGEPVCAGFQNAKCD